MTCPNTIDSAGTLTTSDAVRTNIQSAADADCSLGYCAARSDPGSARAPIFAHNHCRWVDNNSHDAIFVPFKHWIEWQSFMLNKPASVELEDCALPYRVSGASPTVDVTPPYDGSDCNSYTFGTPPDYGRTGSSYYPAAPAIIATNASPGITCHSGNTLMSASLQWAAGDAEATAPGELSWMPHNYFSPDLTLAVTDQTTGTISPSGLSNVYHGDSLQLSWHTSTGDDGQTANCVASADPASGDWSGPMSATGTKPVTLPDATSAVTYTLTCTDSMNLASIAHVTITSQQPYQCSSRCEIYQTMVLGQSNPRTVVCYNSCSGGLSSGPYGPGWTVAYHD